MDTNSSTQHIGRGGGEGSVLLVEETGENHRPVTNH
jgi:hypothetical protein